MRKHFVIFYSPGTFVAEMTQREIESWDVEKARLMAGEITERHGARPYGFQFTTRSRGPDELDSHVTERSGMYYIGGKVETLAEIEAREPDSILARNMRGNGYDRIVTTTDGYRWTRPLEPADVVLE